MLVAGERGGSELRPLLPRYRHLAISVISVAEYFKGVERAATAAQRRGRVAFFNRARATAEIVSLDERVALRAAELWADLERRGAMIPALDLLIAATALARGWPLASADIKDFGRIDGLELVELPAG